MNLEKIVELIKDFFKDSSWFWKIALVLLLIYFLVILITISFDRYKEKLVAEEDLAYQERLLTNELNRKTELEIEKLKQQEKKDLAYISRYELERKREEERAKQAEETSKRVLKETKERAKQAEKMERERLANLPKDWKGLKCYPKSMSSYSGFPGKTFPSNIIYIILTKGDLSKEASGFKIVVWKKVKGRDLYMASFRENPFYAHEQDEFFWEIGTESYDRNRKITSLDRSVYISLYRDDLSMQGVWVHGFEGNCITISPNAIHEIVEDHNKKVEETLKY